MDTQELKLSEKHFDIEGTFQKERGRLLNFIRKSVNKKEDAEDLTQDVFQQMVSAFGEFDSIESVTSWIYRVARNKIIDRYRKKSTTSFSALDRGEELSFENLIPDMSGLPDQLFWQEQVKDTLEAALEELPIQQKEVFIQHELEQVSFKEIAAETGDSVNTLISRKRYAVIHLRKRLTPLYHEMKNLE